MHWQDMQGAQLANAFTASVVVLIPPVLVEEADAIELWCLTLPVPCFMLDPSQIHLQ